jgi:hypothetical protein
MAQMQTGIMPNEPPPIVSAEEVEDKLGPPRVVSMEEWIYSARREIVAGSMRPIDHDAQVNNATFYMQTMAPVVASTPPGQAFNAKMIELFIRLNRYDSEAVQAAVSYRQQMEQISQVQTQAMLAPPPTAPPQAGTPPKTTPEPSQGKEQAAMGMAQ